MDAARWRLIEDLFERAAALPADGRERLLTGEARRDEPLATEVRALLAAHDSHHRFLDAPAPSELPAGMRLGPYAVDGVLGSGGMGTVYLAHRADRQFEKKVAIKVVTSLAATLDDRRFRTERQILAALEHPRIARLLDSGVNEFGQPFLVMELVDGVALDVWHRERKPTLDQCLHVWLQVASAVSYAHRNLVVHRDLKPSNVLVNASGEAKLLDFGIARLLGDPQAPTLTRSYTPLYASPEQIRGEPVTTSADIYGLGVLLFELVAGAHPHQREGMATHEMAAAVLEREPAIPLGVPEDLAAILRFALRKEPLRRYLTVDQFTEDVERFERRLPRRRLSQMVNP